MIMDFEPIYKQPDGIRFVDFELRTENDKFY